MNRINKTVKKGFTLVELIIVMAIFSIILVGVMSLTGPVSRIFRNTSLSEKTYSYANNIQLYLQGKLEYSDNLWIYTQDKIGDGDGTVTDAELIELAENFRYGYYEGLVSYDEASSTGGTKPTEGKIYIMRLANTDNNGATPGQIYLYTFDFASDTPITSAVAPVPQLNSAYFDATDAVYNFSYALGAATLQSVPTPAGKRETYRALDTDFNNDNITLSYQNVALSIVVDKVGNGSIDVAESGYTYRAFENPVTLSIVTLPLTNISFRGNEPPKRYVENGGAIDAKVYDTANGFFESFWKRTGDKVDFEQDIFFVYAYADELV